MAGRPFPPCHTTESRPYSSCPVPGQRIGSRSLCSARSSPTVPLSVLQPWKTVFRIRNPDPRAKKSKKLNHYKIIILFLKSLSFNRLRLMRKSNNHKMILCYFLLVLRNRLDPDSMNTDPEHCLYRVQVLHGPHSHPHSPVLQGQRLSVEPVSLIF